MLPKKAAKRPTGQGAHAVAWSSPPVCTPYLPGGQLPGHEGWPCSGLNVPALQGVLCGKDQVKFGLGVMRVLIGFFGRVRVGDGARARKKLTSLRRCAR